MSTSASSAERWAACPASEALPHSIQPAGEPAHRGRIIHRFLQRALEVGREAALKELLAGEYGTLPVEAAAEVARLCEALPLEELPTDPARYSAEVWMGWLPPPGHVFLVPSEPGGNGVRNVSFIGDERALVDAAAVGDPDKALTREQATAALDRQGWAFGCADVVAIDEESRAGYLNDYKTGFAIAPQRSEQQRLLAFLLAEAKGLDTVHAEVTRLQQDGETFVARWTFDRAELDQIREEVRAALGRVAAARAKVAKGEVPKTYSGSWCAFCPAYLACPAKKSLVQAITVSPDRWEVGLGPVLTAEQVASARPKLVAARQVLERLEEQVAEAADVLGGVYLEDGRWYGPAERKLPPRFVQGEALVDRLRWALDGKAAEVASPPMVSASSLDAAVRDYKDRHQPFDKRSLDAIKDSVYQALKEDGLVVQDTTTEVRERKGPPR